MGISALSKMGYGVNFYSTPFEAITKMKIADDDASAAIISHPGRAELPSPLQHIKASGGEPSSVESIRNFGNAGIESLIRFQELSDQVGNGRFSPETLRNQANGVRSAADTPWRDIWTTFFAPQPASPFGSSPSAYSACPETSVERGMYALAWLKNNGEQAIQAQSNLDAQRVLKLLQT